MDLEAVVVAVVSPGRQRDRLRSPLLSTTSHPRPGPPGRGLGLANPHEQGSVDVDVDVDLDLDVNAVVVAVVSIDGRLLANQAGQHRNNSFKNLSGIFERGFI